MLKGIEEAIRDIIDLLLEDFKLNPTKRAHSLTSVLEKGIKPETDTESLP